MLAVFASNPLTRTLALVSAAWLGASRRCQLLDAGLCVAEQVVLVPCRRIADIDSARALSVHNTDCRSCCPQELRADSRSAPPKPSFSSRRRSVARLKGCHQALFTTFGPLVDKWGHCVDIMAEVPQER